MRVVIGCLVFILSYQIGYSQKVTYQLPKQIETQNLRLRFEKISGSSTSYYINYKIENLGKGVLLIDRKLTALEQNNNQVFPTSSNYILKAGENKLIYNQFRVQKPFEINADLLKLSLDGLKYARKDSTISTKSFIANDNVIQNFGDFVIKIQEYKVYSDRIYVYVKCTYNGPTDKIGRMNLKELGVSGGEPKIVKKGDVIFPSKSYSFAINLTPNGEEVNLDFSNCLEVMSVSKINLNPILIKSTTYIEPPVDTIKSDSIEVVTDTVKTNELSFQELEMLKKDIRLEINSGGQPVGMAHEFLLEKGQISVSQIIEVLTLFNLDGNRLKFAKMAYTFTSDKNKFPLLVGKMAYTKNKQALEEFLEQQ